LRRIGLSIIIDNASVYVRKWNEGSITERPSGGLLFGSAATISSKLMFHLSAFLTELRGFGRDDLPLAAKLADQAHTLISERLAAGHLGRSLLVESAFSGSCPPNVKI